MTTSMLAGRWVHRAALKSLDYLRLMRFHQPIGIFLLGWPVAWAFWIAYEGHPPFNLLGLFLAGTIIMRSAGCIINDIADRNFDYQVQRTKNRPLTNGALRLSEALVLFFSLLFIALWILFQLPSACVYYALVSVFLTSLYPFCKRFMRCPQFVLSLAFSMGIPMAFATNHPLISQPMLILFLINLCWVIAYDTEYAMADQVDDIKIGINSTAIFFGSQVRVAIGLFQTISHLLWFLLISPFMLANYPASAVSLGIWGIGAALLIHQQRKLAQRTPHAYMQAFRSNHRYGFVMWLFCWQYFSNTLN